MSTSSNPSGTTQAEQVRAHFQRQINRLFEEVARLSEQDLEPSNYYGEFLPRVLAGIAAPAGVVWLRTPQGNLQLQAQVNLRQVGLEENEEGRLAHNELLRQAMMTGRPVLALPHSSFAAAEAGGQAAGNPTDFVVLLAPILVDKLVVGLIEVWQEANRNPDARQGFLSFVVQMAGLASVYARNHQLRQMSGQQQLWIQLEAFARQAHNSLNPMEVAYSVANEGRRLVECDRISVAVRRGKKTTIEAISGADVVEKRSNLVQRMRRLSDRVIVWGEKLVYNGNRDDSLPPDVLDALDHYLAESNSKLLVILPLQDEREKDSKKPPRSALVMESFEPAASPEQLMARLEVVGRHATSALYNAVEYRRIPMRFVWLPLAKIQEGLGGKARTITLGVVLGLLLLLWLLTVPPTVLPLPGQTLKMDAKGQLLPKERQWTYSTWSGDAQVYEISPDIKPGSDVGKDQILMTMHSTDLWIKLRNLKNGIAIDEQEVQSLKKQFQDAPALDKWQIGRELARKEPELTGKQLQLNDLIKLTNANPADPRYFYIKSPIAGKILNSDFQEKLRNRTVKPSEPLLRIGNKEGEWEIELKIPQKHIGQVLKAFEKNPDGELDVDVLLLEDPTHVYTGKLARNKIGGEATPNQDEHNESEPVVIAYIRINGSDIPEGERIPQSLLVAGIEVHTKIRCGQHRLGYSLFYGLWEFFYEKVVFFF